MPEVDLGEYMQSVRRVSSLQEVAAAVSAYSVTRAPVHVEQWADGYRWSPAHGGGPYPLHRVAAQFLQVDYHTFYLPFTTSRRGYAYIPPEEATGRPLVTDILSLERRITPEEAQGLITTSLDKRARALRARADARKARRTRKPVEAYVPVQEVTFEVRFPWGGSYVEQMDLALQALGFATAENPLASGDMVGILFAADRATLDAGLALIASAEATFDGDMDDDDFWEWLWEIHDRLGDLGVHWIEQDWKQCLWEEDDSAENAGLTRSLLAETGEGEEHTLTFRLRRQPAP